MLEAARAKQAAGVDVVIGWVETHGRAETAALAEGLERLPPREVEHRGVRLARVRPRRRPRPPARRSCSSTSSRTRTRPAPATPSAGRTRASCSRPGSTCGRRSTSSTSRASTTSSSAITGVVGARDRSPTACSTRRTRSSSSTCRRRTCCGASPRARSTCPTRPRARSSSFFRKGNLTALRELALRRTAERVDADVQDYRRDHAIEATWPVTERVLVCVRPNPESGRLVRAARRLAARLRAEWIVVSVESPGQRAALRRRARATSPPRSRSPSSSGRRPRPSPGPSVSEALLALRARAQRQQDRGRQAGPRPLARSPAGVARRRDRAGAAATSTSSSSPASGPRRPPGPGARSRDRSPRGRCATPGRRRWWRCARSCAGPCSGASTARTWSWSTCSASSFVASRATAAGRPRCAAVLSVAAFDFFFVPPHLTFAVVGHASTSSPSR